MTLAVSVAAVLCVLLLGLYLGRKLASFEKDLSDREEYIKRQTAILGSFVRAVQRGDDLAKLIEKVGAATTPAEFGRLYNEAVSQADGTDPGTMEKPSV